MRARRGYKILRGIALQGGDVDGKGAGRSIYGAPFAARQRLLDRHNTAGIVSMVMHCGRRRLVRHERLARLIQPNDDSGFLDGRYEAFGRVTSDSASSSGPTTCPSRARSKYRRRR